MQLLGAQFRHLDCLDAIYRRDFVGLYLYMGRSVGVSVHPDDWQNCEPRVRYEVEQGCKHTRAKTCIYTYRSGQVGMLTICLCAAPSNWHMNQGSLRTARIFHTQTSPMRCKANSSAMEMERPGKLGCAHARRD